MAFRSPDYLDYSAEPALPGMTPLLTNVPESAESAAGMGRDVYFLSDRPETEEFLKTQAPSYKFLLRDEQGIQERTPKKPSESELDAFQAWKKFKPSLINQLGYDPEKVNPEEETMNARQRFLDKQFSGMTSYEINSIPASQINRIYSEADKYAKAAGRRAEMMARTGSAYRTMFFEQYGKQLESKRKMKEKQAELSTKAAEKAEAAREKELQRKEESEKKLIDTATARAQRDPRFLKADTIEERETIISEYIQMAKRGRAGELPAPKEKVTPPKGKISEEMYADPKYREFFRERLAMAAGLVKDPLKNKEKVKEQFKQILMREGYF